MGINDVVDWNASDGEMILVIITITRDRRYLFTSPDSMIWTI